MAKTDGSNSLRHWRRYALLMGCDLIVCIGMAFAAMFLRFAPALEPIYVRTTVVNLPWLSLPYMLSFTLFGIYTVLWRYADYQRLMIQAVASAVGMVLVLILNAVFTLHLSRYLIVIHGALVGIVSCSERMIARILREHTGVKKGTVPSKRRTLIVGAGMGGNYAIMLCQRSPATLGRPVAMVDDAASKQKMRMNNVSVVGTLADIPQVVKSYTITDILVALPSLKGERMKELLARCNATQCRVQILSDPSKFSDSDADKIDALTLRRPNVSDFLARDEVHLDSRAIGGLLMNKVVLVTGGGGSIGSEICRQIMTYHPKALVIFDIYENSAYELECELRQRYGSDCPIHVVIGSIRDRKRLDAVMAAYRPDVLFHAAAHKHVPLMEYSPAEAVKNNVFGTRNVIEAAAQGKVRCFVEISTDKAVNPTNVMGATKRVTEMLMQYYSRRVEMHCVAVRFGNVLGSHGSVIPLFEQQIAAGGPVTITHPDITRYFMTIPEAAQLVLQAGSMADNGSICVLDMGKPVRIMELAEKMIRFYGLEPGEDIPIRVTGLRPGEKLYEELLMDSEADKMVRTAHNKIMVAPAIHLDDSVFTAQMERLEHFVAEHTEVENDQVLVALLEEMVPTFRHAPLGQYES